MVASTWLPGFSFEWIDAADYERYRPGYAPEAVAWFAGFASLGSQSVVVDLGAGTGKLTRLLVTRAGRVIAVEPAMNMLGRLREVVPRARSLAGSAHAITLADAVADCVTVAHAFHHFADPAALAEIHRVLRPGRPLGLFWAVYQPEDPVNAALDEIIDRYIAPSPVANAAGGQWPKAFERTQLFEQIGVRDFPRPHVLPAVSLQPWLATSSDIPALPTDKRAALLREVQELSGYLTEQVSIAGQTRVHVYRSNG